MIDKRVKPRPGALSPVFQMLNKTESGLKGQKKSSSSFTIEHLALKEREGLLGKAKMLVGACTCCWLAF